MAKDFTGKLAYPIGLRNNNPGNLRDNPSIKWKGQVGSNGGFCTFANMSYGIRAYGINVSSAIHNGYDTIQKLITRYAPPTENNTLAYIKSVSSSSGINPNTKLSTDTSTLAKLARAMFTVELGKSFADMISDSDILEGLNMIKGGTGTVLAVSGIGVIILVIIVIYIFF